MKPVQIDPQGCGCTECLTGLYVPLDRATNGQIARMFKGELYDATGENFQITEPVSAEYGKGYRPTGERVTVVAVYAGIWWELDGIEIKWA